MENVWKHRNIKLAKNGKRRNYLVFMKNVQDYEKC